MPQVSIIIAIYNVAPFLRKCLDSAIGQSFGDLEIIAVNDGSTDHSPEIIREYARKEPRITVVHKENGGLSDARNAGLSIARGKYIAFLDGDDSYMPDFVLKMVNAIRLSNADLACCNYAYTYKGKIKRLERDYLGNLPKTIGREDALEAFLRERIIASVAIKLFRREIIERNAICFPKGQFWEDITFTFDYLKHTGKVAIVREPLYNYFQSDSSITRTKDTLNILDFIAAAGRCVAWVEEKYGNKYAKENSCFFTKAFICLMVYSFKCTDPGIASKLRKELKKNRRRAGLSLLSKEEKALMLLYRIHYRLARLAYRNKRKK